MAKYRVWNGTEWVDACSGGIQIWDGSEWKTIGHGDHVWDGSEWKRIVCFSYSFNSEITTIISFESNYDVIYDVGEPIDILHNITNSEPSESSLFENEITSDVTITVTKKDNNGEARDGMSIQVIVNGSEVNKEVYQKDDSIDFSYTFSINNGDTVEVYVNE